MEINQNYQELIEQNLKLKFDFKVTVNKFTEQLTNQR